MPGRLLTVTAALACAALGVGAAGCGGDEETAPADVDTTLTGRIVADGSSTVAPLTQAAADRFTEEHPLVSADVRISGTGGGFEVFCTGQTDISNASRRITPEEAAECARNGVRFEPFRVASDGITVITRKGADPGTDCLTLDQLRRVWIKGSRIDNWRQIDPDFTDSPLTLAGPGADSGTFDFFNERVLGEGPDGETLEPRQDYTASEDDDVIVAAVEASQDGMGYLGYSYYADNSDRLDAMRLDAGQDEGCITPSVDTITGGDYPLARPLFIYVSKTSLERPEVRAFVRDYLENAPELASETNVPPANRTVLDEGLLRLRRNE